MTQEEFEEIFEATIARLRTKVFDLTVDDIRETLIVKAKDYAIDGDRMHNFKMAADLNDVTPEQALWGFLTKHIVSVRDMVAEGDPYPDSRWDEKLGDYLVYGLLLRALVEETGRCYTPALPTSN